MVARCTDTQCGNNTEHNVINQAYCGIFLILPAVISDKSARKNFAPWQARVVRTVRRLNRMAGQLVRFSLRKWKMFTPTVLVRLRLRRNNTLMLITEMSQGRNLQ